MNLTAVALRREVHTMPHGEEFGEIGFTPEDRAALITLVANERNLRDVIEGNQRNMRELFADLRSRIEQRLDRIEQDRAYKVDLERIERNLRSELAEKANRTELSGSALTKLSEDVGDMNIKITWAYAWAAGVAAAGVFIGWLLKH